MAQLVLIYGSLQVENEVQSHPVGWLSWHLSSMTTFWFVLWRDKFVRELVSSGSASVTSVSLIGIFCSMLYLELQPEI